MAETTLTPELESFMRREIQREVKAQLNASYGVVGAASSQRYTPEEWDFQVIQANEFPGFGYEHHATVGVSNNVYMVWRIRRDQAMKVQGYKPILKLPNQ